jgi:hypothetical protein
MHDCVRTLAKRAVRMGDAIRMGVGKLYRGAEKEKDREEAYKQSPSACIGCSRFLDPQHSYQLLYRNFRMPLHSMRPALALE